RSDRHRRRRVLELLHSRAALQVELDAIHFERQGVEARLFENAQDLGHIFGRETHRWPPKMFMTCSRGLSVGLATGACSLAAHTVSGRLCRRKISPERSMAHSMSCGRP